MAQKIRQIIKYHKLLHYIEFMSKLLAVKFALVELIPEWICKLFQADKHFSLYAMRYFCFGFYTVRWVPCLTTRHP